MELLAFFICLLTAMSPKLSPKLLEVSVVEYVKLP